MFKAPIAILSLLLIAVMALTVTGCSLSSDNATDSEPSGTIDSVKQQANTAAREANLRIIDSAIQAYYAEQGTYPTSLNQLSQYFASGVPSDPAGGTYYIVTENGVAEAAVK
jgi:streptomycin 6-kinase